MKLKDYLDGATVLFDAAGNVDGGYSLLRRLRGCVKLSALSGIDAPGGAIQRKPSGPDPFLKYSGSARAG